MNRLFFTTVLLFLSLSLFASSISFSGGESSLRLKEGQEMVTLSDGAKVTADTLTIESERIQLSGNDWRFILCEGKTIITDRERGIEIRTNYIWYDRIEELLLISAWFEIDDTNEELSAQGGSLRYDMKNEELELGMQVQLLKISDGDVMKCTSESVQYHRKEEKVALRGGSHVTWKGDSYEAEVISIDLNTNSIQLEGRIKGTING